MSPAEPPADGATPVPAAVGFPLAPGDPESIELAARRLGGVADGLDVQAGTMRSTATLLADFWRGHAASAYQALSSIITEHFHVAGETSRSAATALRRYGLELERCRRKGMAATAQAERCLNEIKFQTRRLHDAQLRVSVAQDALSAARADGARARAEGPFGTARAAVADLEAIASSPPGMVGAALANLANEAALLAARRGHDKVEMADLTDSLEKIMLGAPRGILLAPADRERTAYHEAGHALVGMLTPGADPVRKVSIIPRGMALGVTLSTPDSDRVSYSREDLSGKILVALGGRVAEEIVYGTITTGAESDIQQLTQIARQMVGRWGMSEAIGPVAVLPSEGSSQWLPGASETSADTQRLIDHEVHEIITEAQTEVMQLLLAHREQLNALAHALLEVETLDAVDAYAAAGLPAHIAEPDVVS